MPKICLVGTAQHRSGVHNHHFVHPAAVANEKGERALSTATFVNGVADVDGSVADFLCDSGLTTRTMLPVDQVIDIARPGLPAVVSHDPETGAPIVLQEAIDAPRVKAPESGESRRK